MRLAPPDAPPVPCTTLFRSLERASLRRIRVERKVANEGPRITADTFTRADVKDAVVAGARYLARGNAHPRSEEHTSELQSHSDLVCRLLLAKKTKMQQIAHR